MCLHHMHHYVAEQQIRHSHDTESILVAYPSTLCPPILLATASHNHPPTQPARPPSLSPRSPHVPSPFEPAESFAQAPQASISRKPEKKSFVSLRSLVNRFRAGVGEDEQAFFSRLHPNVGKMPTFPKLPKSNWSRCECGDYS